MKRFWVSWYANGFFLLHGPWWVSGFRMSDDVDCICAAVIAESEEQAMEQICRAHDDTSVKLEWRFCAERPQDWEPFCERFPRQDWMVWPATVTTNEAREQA